MTTNNGQSNGYATIQQLTEPGKRRFKDVELPVRGGKVLIRSLFEHESEAFQMQNLKRNKRGVDVSAYRRLIILCAVDSSSKEPMFSDAHLEIFSLWDAADVNHLGGECSRFCGFSEGEMERMEKNSETAPVES